MKESSLKSNNNSVIDAVITWVDGNDPVHLDKMQSHLLTDKIPINKEFKTRYFEVNEIEYCVRSINKFAPYIRNIYIVSDNQKPKFLDSYSQNKEANDAEIILVDHKNIFQGYENYLPVFSSRAIEIMLLNIKGLSEQFIYFNDDILLINRTEPTDFFKDGKTIIRGKWSKMDSDIWYKNLNNSILNFFGRPAKHHQYGFKRAQQIAARRFGYDKYLRIDHTPNAIRKSAISAFLKVNPEIVTNTVKHKFRHPEQSSFQSLANYQEIENETCLINQDYQLIYIGSYKKPIIWYRYKFLNGSKNKLFLNLQNLNLAHKNKLPYFLNWLNRRFQKFEN